MSMDYFKMNGRNIGLANGGTYVFIAKIVWTVFLIDDNRSAGIIHD